VYFPQGHSEQVSAQAHHARESYVLFHFGFQAQTPNYPLPVFPKFEKNPPFFTQVLGEFLLQVAASTNKEMESQIPNYPNLPPQLICQLHNVTMHVSLGPWNTFFLELSNFRFVFHYLCYFPSFRLMQRQMRYMHR
jgi:hypothetical protein